MPQAHVQHLATITHKLEARGVDPLEALEACAAGEHPTGDAVYAGLGQVLAALGFELVRAALERLRSGRVGARPGGSEATDR